MNYPSALTTHRPVLALVGTELRPIPQVKGGAIQTYIAAVVPFLKAHFQVTIFSPAHMTLADDEVVDGVRYLRFHREDRLDYYQQIAFALRVEDWDVVVVYNQPIAVSWLQYAAPEADFFLSIHNDMFHPELTDPETARLCLSQVKRVVTISHFIAARTASRYPQYMDKCLAVWAGVDLDAFSRQEAGDLNVPLAKRQWAKSRDMVVICIAQLVPGKGVHVLMEAWRDLWRENPKLGLLIVGSPSLGENFRSAYSEKLAQMGSEMGDSVMFSGYVPYAKMPAYFSLGHVLVCPSIWDEALARVHYEAMAAELALVTARSGGNREVILEGCNGFSYGPAEDKKALLQVLRPLVRDKQRAMTMGVFGRKRAETRHGWGKTADQLVQAWLPKRKDKEAMLCGLV